MDEVFSSWLDLSNQPIGHLDIEYFTNGSSFVCDGTGFSGYAVVTLDSVIEARLPLVGTSAQNAELITLTRALQFAAGVWVNIYTDSKYAFTTIHVHESYIKRGDSLTWEEKLLSMGWMLHGPLNRWQLYSAEGIKREMQ
jgi:ribonuclease HI